MQDLENTQYFKVEVEPENGVKMILSEVYEALSEKGYDPVSQIVGYIMSGDPTYITSHYSFLQQINLAFIIYGQLNDYKKENANYLS